MGNLNDVGQSDVECSSKSVCEGTRGLNAYRTAALTGTVGGLQLNVQKLAKSVC